MHALTRRTIRVGAVLVVAGASLLTFGAEPAGAADCVGRGCGGEVTPSGYSAWAALASAWGGGGGRSLPEPCTFVREVPDPEAIYGDAPGIEEEVDGFIEVNVSGDNPLGGTPGQVIVSISCTEPGHEGESNMEFGAIPTFDLLQWAFVPLLDPAELVEQALADMPVGSPDIQTSPGDGNSSLVGIETWLMLDEATFGPGSRTDTDGLISVTVWAEPDPSEDVVWNTGEGTETCAGSGQPGGSCTWTYERSSAGQTGTDGAGRPAYGITASVTYTGGFSVSVAGIPVGGVDDLGDITRTSEPYLLAVDEAQALNTGG